MSDERFEEIEIRLVVPRELGVGVLGARLISQKTCAVFGLDERRYLELLRRPDAPPARKLGKLRLIDSETFSAFLRRITEESNASKEGLDDPDKLLTELGFSPRPDRR
jgi:hypothetical protein